MKSVFREISSIQLVVKAALSSLEPRIVLLPTPNHHISGTSPGEILVSIQNHQSANPVADLKKVRSEWATIFKRESKRLDSIERHGFKLAQVINFVENGAPMPTMNAPQLVSAARSLRTAKLAGSDMESTTRTARRSVDAGLAEIRRIKNVVFPSWQNAANVILFKHGSNHLSKCSQAEVDLDKALTLELKADLFERLHQRYRQKNLNRARVRDTARMRGMT